MEVKVEVAMEVEVEVKLEVEVVINFTCPQVWFCPCSGGPCRAWSGTCTSGIFGQHYFSLKDISFSGDDLNSKSGFKIFFSELDFKYKSECHQNIVFTE